MSGTGGVDAASIDPFNVSVKKWIALAGSRADEAFLATCLDAVDRVKQLTPVKTGYLRANWTAVREGDQMPVAGSETPAETALAGLKWGETVYIVNPVVYARRIEYGFVGEDSAGRHYNQAGRGMLQQTVQELPQIAEQAVLRIISGGPADTGGAQ
jgi:hypothetical protein